MLFQTALALMELYGTRMAVCDLCEVACDELYLLLIWWFKSNVIFLYVILCRSCISHD